MEYTSQLDFILKFNAINKAKCHIDNEPDAIFFISKADNKFEIMSDEFDDLKIEDRSIIFTIGEENFHVILENFGSYEKGKSVGRSGFSQSYRCDVATMKSLGFSKKEDSSKFRAYFPVNSSKLESVVFIFETIKYRDGSQWYKGRPIMVTIESDTFLITLFGDVQKHCIIECISTITYDRFSHTCFAIQQMLGFFTGYMPGGGHYVFAGEQEFCYSSYCRPEVSGFYWPININPYSKFEANDAGRFIGKLTLISQPVISKFVSLLLHDGRFSSAVMLMLESGSLKSVLLMPSVFAVVLESLSKIITGIPVADFIPMDGQVFTQKALPELTAVIDKYTSYTGQVGSQKMKNRLAGINQAVVGRKLSNDEKLTRPFETLGLPLTDFEYSIIRHRNDVLHGDILMACKNQVTYETDNYMAFVSAKLYTLISGLILKHLGYSGYIINHARLFEFGTLKDEGRDCYWKI
jgi:hypothetical protein